jgi:hypothetical protein
MFADEKEIINHESMNKILIYKKVKFLLVEILVFFCAYQISCFRDEKSVWVRD